MEGVRGLREREESLLVLRLELGDLLVGLDRAARRGLVPRDRALVGRAGLVRGSRAERVGAQRLAELAIGTELAPRACLRLLERRSLGHLEGRVRLPELEVAEMTKRDDVLRPELPVLEPRGDRVVGLALCLVGLRKLLAIKGVEGALGELLLRRGDRRARRPAPERVAHQLAQVEAARAD